MRHLLGSVGRGAALVGVGSAVVWALLALPAPAPPASPGADRGIGNPVTAYLLDVRAFDTMLELAVLLAALAGVRALGVATDRTREAPSPVLRGLVRLLLPVGVVVAGWLLQSGTSAPGGAFQTGAVLGALVLLWWLADLPRVAVGARARRVLAACGIAAFLVAGGLALVWGGPWLRWPDGGVKAVVLAIEALATVSIATILVALFGDDAEAVES